MYIILKQPEPIIIGFKNGFTAINHDKKTILHQQGQLLNNLNGG